MPRSKNVPVRKVIPGPSIANNPEENNRAVILDESRDDEEEETEREVEPRLWELFPAPIVARVREQEAPEETEMDVSSEPAGKQEASLLKGKRRAEIQEESSSPKRARGDPSSASEPLEENRTQQLIFEEAASIGPLPVNSPPPAAFEKARPRKAAKAGESWVPLAALQFLLRIVRRKGEDATSPLTACQAELAVDLHFARGELVVSAGSQLLGRRMLKGEGQNSLLFALRSMWDRSEISLSQARLLVGLTSTGEISEARLVLTAELTSSLLGAIGELEGTRVHKDLRALVLHLFPPSSSLGLNHFQPSNASDFFENFVVPRMPVEAQPKGLVPTLFPFQAKALSWMLQRERVRVDHAPAPQPTAETQHPLWEKVTTFLGLPLWINRISGAMTRFALPAYTREEGATVSGGILAEEMGLGKTVEILALICRHRRSQSQVQPLADPTDVDSGATLIVSPSSIIFQWVSEIHEHAPDLSFFIYEGVRSKLIPAEELAKYDVVLTTYDVLRAEINYAQEHEARALRHQKKYTVPKSPLVQIRFWRICLDEAQMVESTTAKAAEMALKLQAVNKWAVTGTPIGKNGIDDLYGLLLFLNLTPWSDHFWWKHLTDLPDREQFLLKLLHGILWRTRKCDVLNEIKLPPQQEETIFLNFSPIESANYKPLHNLCLEKVRANLLTDSEMTSRAEVNGFLLRLRQTCCHPQIGTKNQRVFGDTPKTMEEVLDLLVKQAQADLGSAERAHCQNRINQALMLELQKEFEPALELYGTALTLVLQRKAETLQDLEQEKEREREKEKEKEKEAEEGAKERQEGDAEGQEPNQASASKGNGKGKERERETKAGSPGQEEEEIPDDPEANKEEKESKIRSTLKLWLELEHHLRFNIASIHLEQEKKELADKEFDDAELVRKEIFEPAEKLVRHWQTKLQGRFELRFGSLVVPYSEFTGGFRTQSLFARWKALALELNRSLDPLREVYEKIKATLFEDLHQNYEEDLKKQDDLDQQLDNFAFVLNKRRELLTGSHISTSAEIKTRSNAQVDFESLKNSMKSLLRDFRRMLVDLEAEEGFVAENEKEIVAREIKNLSAILRSQTKGLEMADSHNTRFRLLGNARILYYRQLQTLSDEVAVPQVDDPVERHKQLKVEEVGVKKSIAALSSRVRYLKNLGKDEELSCGICKAEMVGGMLTECGHTFCEACIMIWVVKHRNCPMCQYKLNNLDQLKRVTFDKAQVEEGEHHPALVQTTIEGSYGTKLEAVLRYIKHLNRSEPDTKSLVFSQWEQVLGIFVLALQKNNIKYVRLEGPGKREATKAFRTNPDIKVFILNAKNQSSGLTLVAATHVFLVEPVLNPAIELQAISRVHRIGQTKPTYVHRIIIKDTIESKILELSEKDREKGKQPGAEGPGADEVASASFQQPKEQDLRANDYEFLFDLGPQNTTQQQPREHEIDPRLEMRARLLLAAESRVPSSSASASSASTSASVDPS